MPDCIFCYSYFSEVNVNVICLPTEHQGQPVLRFLPEFSSSSPTPSRFYACYTGYSKEFTRTHSEIAKNVRAFKKCWSKKKGRGENRSTRRKTSRSRVVNQPHTTTPGPGIEPGTHWWEASLLRQAACFDTQLHHGKIFGRLWSARQFYTLFSDETLFVKFGFVIELCSRICCILCSLCGLPRLPVHLSMIHCLTCLRITCNSFFQELLYT